MPFFPITGYFPFPSLLRLPIFFVPFFSFSICTLITLSLPLLHHFTHFFALSVSLPLYFFFINHCFTFHSSFNLIVLFLRLHVSSSSKFTLAPLFPYPYFLPITHSFVLLSLLLRIFIQSPFPSFSLLTFTFLILSSSPFNSFSFQYLFFFFFFFRRVPFLSSSLSSSSLLFT